jgi:hypothetical protein
VDDQAVGADARDRRDRQRAVVVAHDAELAVHAEAERLAVDERDAVGVGLVAIGEVVEGAVVEDRAVLQHLDERRAAVLGSGAQDLDEALLVAIDGAGDERRAGADGERQRIERRVDRAGGRRLGDLADLARRRGLALRQAVDAVVEEQDLDRDVAAQRVDQVVGADRQRIAVAGDDPHRQVVARGGQPGRDRGGAPVDGVHPIGVHVVREAAGAADAGDEDDLLGRDPQLGHEALDGGEHRVVAAARAPARLLVGLEVGLSEGQRGSHQSISRIARSISPASSGRPSTRV